MLLRNGAHGTVAILIFYLKRGRVDSRLDITLSQRSDQQSKLVTRRWLFMECPVKSFARQNGNTYYTYLYCYNTSNKKIISNDTFKSPSVLDFISLWFAQDEKKQFKYSNWEIQISRENHNGLTGLPYHGNFNPISILT